MVTQPIDAKKYEGEFTGNFLGAERAYSYSVGAIAYAIVALRFLMGWIFLQAGLDKLATEGWTATGYLANAVSPENPFHGFFTGMAGSGFVDALNLWGQILIGIALILGLFTRWTAFWGALMMILYWMVSLQGGLGDFLPLEHGYVVDDHLVYAVLLFGLGAFGAGRIFGLDAIIEKLDIVKQNTWLRYVLG